MVVVVMLDADVVLGPLTAPSEALRAPMQTHNSTIAIRHTRIAQRRNGGGPTLSPVRHDSGEGTTPTFA